MVKWTAASFSYQESCVLHPLYENVKSTTQLRALDSNGLLFCLPKSWSCICLLTLLDGSKYFQLLVDKLNTEKQNCFLYNKMRYKRKTVKGYKEIKRQDCNIRVSEPFFLKKSQSTAGLFVYWCVWLLFHSSLIIPKMNVIVHSPWVTCYTFIKN